MPFPMILNDLEDYSPRCKDFEITTNINFYYKISHGFNWHSASRGPLTTAELIVLKEVSIRECLVKAC